MQDAKNQFSRVLEKARTEGPQTITKHGQAVVVMVAAEEFKKLTKPKESALEFFSRFKGINLEGIRSKELPRKVEL